MIVGRGVTVDYGDTRALGGVDVSAGDGETVGLIGPNGSGKTSLLRTLYGAQRPSAGVVTVDGDAVGSLAPRELARRVAVVPQEGATEFPLSVAEMVLLGRSPHRSALQSYRVEDRRAAATALRRVGMRELADRSFATLSGGEKQRVLIARALAQDSPHLLLDEPTNHLDVRYQHEVLELVQSLEVTAVVVLHDLNLAARYCDRLVLLGAGALRATGTPEEVLVPDLVEDVYRIGVRRFDDDGCVQLVFRPGRGPAGPAARVGGTTGTVRTSSGTTA